MGPRQPLPRLWMMTDERQGEGLFEALERLPESSGVVFRHYSLVPEERRRLFDRIASVAKPRNVTLTIAGEPALAEEWGADGSHGPPHRQRSHLLRSSPVHDLDELQAAERAGADFVFASPVFPTRSHPGAATLGPEGLRSLVERAQVPVIALGGMTAARAEQLSGTGIYGWAAIDAWSPP